MATLALKKVKKFYLGKPVIHEINIDVNDGEMIVVVGPSGCGKSTLLRMIAGLDDVSDGEIIVDGHVINELGPKRRDIAMVFQNYALYPHMTVYKNMAYGLTMRGYSKNEIRKRVASAAKTLELGKLLKRKPHELSGGQRQRVAMGRAIVRNPKIFLFDEPLSNLDAKLRVQMRLEIRKLQQQLRTTTIYVTHDQVEAMTLADRLIVMRKGGVVEQIGSPIDIYLKPATQFVGGFMGSPAMNFLSAKLSQDGKVIEIAQGETKLPLTDAMTSHAGKQITLGIRPEHIKRKIKEGADQFKLKVDFLELLGTDTLVYGNLLGDNQTICARMPGKWRANQNELVTLGVNPDSLHIFDPETGKRLN